MSHLSGKAGFVSITGDATGVAGIKSWTIDYTADVLETTDFADAGVKTFVVGGSGWSGTFEGLKDAAPIALGTGGSISLRLYENATLYWAGTAFITGISAAAANDGVVTYSYTFQGTAGLTAALTT